MFGSASIHRPFIVAQKLISIPCRFNIISSPLPDIVIPKGNYISLLHKDIDRFADRSAIVDDQSGEAFSYTQLRQATLAVASGLKKNGLGHGSRVTIFTNNRPEFVFALHGAVAGGCVASPINCNYTAGELEHPLRDAGTSAVVTDVDRLPVVREAMHNVSSVRQVYLIGETETKSRELGCLPFDNLLNDNGSANGNSYADVDSENDLAYLPYSSGTSGLPKGVMLTHRNVISNVLMTKAMLENEIASEIVAGVLPFFHIYALTVIIGNVIQTGGTLITIPKFDPEKYLQLIIKYKTDELFVAPPIILYLLQHPLVKQSDLSFVRRIMSGGAPLGREVELEAVERFPHCDVFQGYGLTESSPIAFICPRKHRRPKDGSAIGSIGICAPSQEVKIVDTENKKILGTREVGEIAIRGPHIMKGYLGLPEATSECIDEDGWFYTGDVGYVDENKYFFITDRVKELIKYKGFQVAPAEVESVLLSHPQITDCAVVGRKDLRAGELAVAFVVRQSDGLSEEEINEFLKSRLAPHKQLHGGIIFVDSVPKSPSGKLLRRLLRDQLNKK